MKKELSQRLLAWILAGIFLITFSINLKGYPSTDIHFSLFTNILGGIFCFFAGWGSGSFLKFLFELISNAF